MALHHYTKETIIDDRILSDPVLFFARLIKAHFDERDFTQSPIVRTRTQTMIDRNNGSYHYASAPVIYELNWNRKCVLENAQYLGSQYFKIIDEHCLENKFLALPAEHLYLYLFLELNYKFFDEAATTGTFDYRKLEFLLQPLIPKTPESKLRLELLADFSIIAKSFLIQSNNNYRINVEKMTFAWNDIALPSMVKEKRTRRKRFASTGFDLSGVVSGTKETDEVDFFVQEFKQRRNEFPLVRTFDLLDLNFIQNVAKRFCKIRTSRTDGLHYSFIHYFYQVQNSERAFCVKQNEHIVSQFLYETFSEAVTVNGTACVGKTTLLKQSISEINAKLDKNARIFKASDFGGFAGKDTEQLFALQYQLCPAMIAKLKYTSIFDRGVYNNMIWRIIMALQNTNESLIDLFIQIFAFISPLTIELMKKQPTIIILDSDVCRNRRKMFARDQGGDYHRCRIERYVVAQNVVYGVFATICNWPLIDLADFSSGDDESLIPSSVSDKIINLIVEKTQLNIQRNGNNLPSIYLFEKSSLLLSRHKFVLDHKQNTNNKSKNDHNIDYSVAQNLEIFK